MKLKQLHEAVSEAYTTKKREDGSEYITTREGLAEEVKDLLSTAQFESDLNMEVSYDIYSTASSILSDIDTEDLDRADANELAQDCCSVYTYTRLQLLDGSNENDITEIMKEYGTEDISTACAIWYDQKTAEALQTLITLIQDNAEEDEEEDEAEGITQESKNLNK